ncbi:flagellar hook-basal body protein [Maledivibacter halophilus]|uniref:Flagellar basal-body rod protein FlgG n=1 Tax=Maledivibacter halophilus TaxID=36842 RepID=A0A1T5JXM6_9FIRM|nr:flagellar hook-basal body protein [Maledivibacter halophilus]SKC56133.1 flagellar basal-body rod protein FlgG [Maledivibacter halophilus]
MFRGLYMGSSSLITNNRKIDVVSNNIANVNTTGFKKDLVLLESFEDALISKMDGNIIPENLTKFHEVEVNDKNGYFEVKSDTGYMRVKTPTGISYHDKARFTVGEDGFLRTFYKDREGRINSDYGYEILGNSGSIYVGEGELNIDENGRVFVDGEMVDSLITFTHPSVIGTMNSGVKLERIETNFQQGQLIQTENPLDFAIKGSGFFTVETDEGIRYTRDGSFKLNSDKELVTSEGHRVQGMYGNIILDGEEISLTPAGEIMMDGEIIDKLDIVSIENLRDLRKTERGLYKIEENIELEEEIFEGQVFQGRLEKSNVNPIKEMIEMMTLYRGYESSQRVIKTYDETIGKVVNEVGKV